MGKWLLKMGIFAAISLGLTYAEAKMMNKILFNPQTEMGSAQEPKKNQVYELNKDQYEVR